MKYLPLLFILIAMPCLGQDGLNKCKYTVAEIDALRSAIENRYIWGTSCIERVNGISRSYSIDELTKTVEERTRTYMLGCIKAEDILIQDGCHKSISQDDSDRP